MFGWEYYPLKSAEIATNAVSRQNSVCLGSSLSMISFAIEEPGSRTLCHPGADKLVCWLWIICFEFRQITKIERAFPFNFFDLATFTTRCNYLPFLTQDIHNDEKLWYHDIWQKINNCESWQMIRCCSSLVDFMWSTTSLLPRSVYKTIKWKSFFGQIFWIFTF